MSSKSSVCMFYINKFPSMNLMKTCSKPNPLSLTFDLKVSRSMAGALVALFTFAGMIMKRSRESFVIVDFIVESQWRTCSFVYSEFACQQNINKARGLLDKLKYKYLPLLHIDLRIASFP